MTEDEYQAFIGAQAAGANAYVENRLGQLCMDLGYPRDQWCTWKFQDALARITKKMVEIRFDYREFHKRIKTVQAALDKNQLFMHTQSGAFYSDADSN